MAFAVEAPFLGLVPMALLQLLPAPVRESPVLLPVMFGLQTLKTLFLVALLVGWLRPAQQWMRGVQTSDEELVRASRAVYRLPVRFGTVWAVTWWIFPLATLGLTVALRPSLAEVVTTDTLAIIVLVALALLCAALPLASAMLAFLVAPVSGEISLQLRERKLPQDYRSVGLRRRLLLFAVSAALAPTAWMSALGMTTSLDRGVLMFYALVALIWAPICGWFMAHSVGEPLRRIAELVAEITRAGPGASRVRVPVFFEDELGALARGANDLADRLMAYDQELHARMAQLEAQHASTQEALRIRDEFLSLASHELRTPLTTVSLSLEQLALGEATGRPPRAALDRARRQTRQLAGLVRDLLDVSRIQAGKMEMHRQPVELGALVRESVATVAELPSAQPVTIEVDETPAPLNADPARLEQVVVNLLENAFKYGSGRPVTVRLRKVAANGAAGSTSGAVRLEVQDHGPGIPPEQLEVIFDRFHRGAEARIQIRGLGLGLYVCRSIVREHGGRIWAESTLGEGATFFVELPLAG